MPSGVKDIQLLELKDTISQLNKTISTQNELISSLQKMLEERNAKDSEKDLLIANLQSQLAYLKNKVFGSTSEIRHDQLDGQLNLFGTPVGDEKPAEVIEPEVISVKGYTKERKPKATYDDKYNSVRSICKHFFTDIVGLSIKFFCVSLRHMSIVVADVFDAEKRSDIMRQVKSKKNKSTELRLIEIFKQNGITGWRRNYPVKGHPDFVFPKKKIAVFVDGCFWHGHDCRNTRPADHQEYWQKKRERNMEHDREVTAMFEARGWTVLRIWECELKKKNLDCTVKKINQILSVERYPGK